MGFLRRQGVGASDCVLPVGIAGARAPAVAPQRRLQDRDRQQRDRRAPEEPSRQRQIGEPERENLGFQRGCVGKNRHRRAADAGRSHERRAGARQDLLASGAEPRERRLGGPQFQQFGGDGERFGVEPRRARRKQAKQPMRATGRRWRRAGGRKMLGVALSRPRPRAAARAARKPRRL